MATQRDQILQRFDALANSETDPRRLALIAKLRERISRSNDPSISPMGLMQAVNATLNDVMNEQVQAAVNEARSEAASLINRARVVVEMEGYEEPCHFDEAIQMHGTRVNELRKQLEILERRLDDLTAARDSTLYGCIHDYEKHVAARELVEAHNLRAQKIAQQRLQAAEAKFTSQPAPLSTPPLAGVSTGVASKASTSLPVSDQ